MIHSDEGGNVSSFISLAANLLCQLSSDQTSRILISLKSVTKLEKFLNVSYHILLHESLELDATYVVHELESFLALLALLIPLLRKQVPGHWDVCVTRREVR